MLLSVLLILNLLSFTSVAAAVDDRDCSIINPTQIINKTCMTDLRRIVNQKEKKNKDVS